MIRIKTFFSNFKVSLLLLICLISIIAGCSNSSENTLEKFQNALDKRDPKALYSLVNIADDIYWTEEQASYVIESFLDDIELYEEQLYLLHSQIEAIKNKKPLFNEEGLFYFDSEGTLNVRGFKLSLLEDSVKGATEITLKVNDDDELKINPTEKEDLVLGLFGPGKYHIWAEAIYEHATTSDEDYFEIINFGSFNEDIELDLKGETVYVFSELPETKLLVNDKDIKIDLDNDFEFGPVSDGLKLQGKTELPWGEAKSKEYIIDIDKEEDNYDLTPLLLKNETERKEIEELINNFGKQRIKALVEKNTDVLENVSEEVINKIKDEYEGDITYVGEGLGTEINYSEVGYESEKNNEGNVMHFIYIPVVFNDNFSLGVKDYGIPSPTEQSESMLLELEDIADKEKWIINDFDAYFGYSGYTNGEEEDIVKTQFK